MTDEHSCHDECPCHTGGEPHADFAQTDPLPLATLANTLRQQHHPGLPWHQLKASERQQWLAHAQTLVNREPA